MAARLDGQPEKIRQKLVELLASFKDELHAQDLRSKVLSLVHAHKLVSELGAALISVEGADAAKDRILYYLRKYPRTVISREELMIVAGISEWARRLRELRTEEGWRIVTGDTAKEMAENGDFFLAGVDASDMGPDDYVLLDETQDVDAKARWVLANEIRKTDASMRDKILRFLRSNVGKVVTGEELRYVAGGKTEWARRVRELRTEQGWPISTKTSGRPDLPVGAYILESEERLPEHDRHIPAAIYKAVLERDGYACQRCGWKKELETKSDPRHLQLHHIKQHAHGGANEATNLVTLCTKCHSAEPKEKGSHG